MQLTMLRCKQNRNYISEFLLLINKFTIYDLFALDALKFIKLVFDVWQGLEITISSNIVKVSEVLFSLKLGSSFIHLYIIFLLYDFYILLHIKILKYFG